MLRSFIAWLDGYLAGEDTPAVIKAIVGIMSFAVLLGTILGNDAVKSGLLVAVVFCLISVVVVLLGDRRSLYRDLELHRVSCPTSVRRWTT